MNEASDKPARYDVSYSQRVRDELRSLIVRAHERGKGHEVLEAVEELDRRLRIYPQFGQPLRDLFLRPLQLWIGALPPLVVRYVLNEEKRQVMVGVPLRWLSKSEV